MKSSDILKTAIIYHYYELDPTYKNNLIFFLNTAVSNKYEYYIYISGKCSATLPEASNIHYNYIENKNNDFGGVIQFFKDTKSKSFLNYIFINSSVRGPFIPKYYKNDWPEIFLSLLSDEVVLVGSAINILPSETSYSKKFQKQYNFNPPFVHVQTPSFALSSHGFKLLEKKGFFDHNTHLSKLDIIFRYEILMSTLIINNGLSIRSILPIYNKFDFNNRNLNINGTSINGDVSYKSAFYGRSISPIEMIFIKTNRNMITKRELASYTLTSLAEKDKDTFITKDGIKLLEESLKNIYIEDHLLINFDQIKNVLINIKKNHPEVAIKLHNILKWFFLKKKDIFWCPRTDSNRGPIDYKSIALPAELQGRTLFL